MFVAEIKVSEEWLHAASVQQEKLKVARKLLNAVKAFCLILMLALDVFILVKGAFIAALVTIGLTVLLIFSRSLDRFILARRRRKSPFWNQTVRIELDEEALRESSELATSSARWEAFTRCIGVRDGFLLYQGPYVFYWLPTTAFFDGPQREAVAEFLKRKIKKYEEA